MSQPIPVTASDWNHFFDLAAIIALVAVAVVIGSMIYFVVRYRAGKGELKFVPELGPPKSRPRENVIFASISIIILVSLVVASFALTPNPRFAPDPSKSLTINVTAFQWDWRFDYPNGVTTLGNVTLPGDTVIMFNVTSADVMHNFYLVQYKVSMEAVPGRYNVFWITTPAATGNQVYTYNIYCKELCGVGHTFMDGYIIVLSPTAYEQWLASQIPANSTATGG